jgi:Protein of unknown function (DUF2975)
MGSCCSTERHACYSQHIEFFCIWQGMFFGCLREREPFVYLLAEKDDAPGLILIDLVPIFASMVIAVFTAVLQRLLHEAVEIKSENDLII